MSTWSRTHVMPLPSAANLREHTMERARRVAGQRQIGYLLVAANSPPTLPVTVTITRIAPRALDDDNLAYSAKALRDGIADALGVNDRDPRVSWAYAQERGKPAAIRITIEARS